MQFVRATLTTAVTAAALTILLASPSGAQTALPQAPLPARKPHVTKIHGDTLTDNYFWLREKSNPEVIAHLEAENAYTAAVMKDTETLQKTLYGEMLGHIKQTDVNVPYLLGGYYYYSRTEEGKQYPILRAQEGKHDCG